MAIVGIEWHSAHAWGNGYYSIQVNIPPAWVAAQVSLHGHTGGGTSYTGIRAYRRRLSSGADRDIDFGAWTGWPPVIYDFISSVTFGIATGSNQHGWLVARMDYWA